MNNLEFALEMKNKRLASGLSQGELASLTHVSRYSINRFENGKANASKETQNIILDWVFWNFYPAQKIYPHLTSDDLKEVLYKRTQIHLHNNQFKEAMLINGFWPRDPSELNWVFHIQASSPAIRTQADGYPGIPIIGRQELNEYRKKSCARR